MSTKVARIGVVFYKQWIEGAIYDYLDYVRDEKGTFMCLAEHVASTANRPNGDSELWAVIVDNADINTIKIELESAKDSLSKHGKDIIKNLEELREQMNGILTINITQALDQIEEAKEKLDEFINNQKDGIKAQISSVYKFKGLKQTVLELQSLSNMQIGDVWDVAEKGGMNYAYNGESWDALGASVDLSEYVTKEELESKLQTHTSQGGSSSFKLANIFELVNGFIFDVFTSPEEQKIIVGIGESDYFTEQMESAKESFMRPQQGDYYMRFIKDIRYNIPSLSTAHEGKFNVTFELADNSTKDIEVPYEVIEKNAQISYSDVTIAGGSYVARPTISGKLTRRARASFVEDPSDIAVKVSLGNLADIFIDVYGSLIQTEPYKTQWHNRKVPIKITDGDSEYIGTLKFIVGN